MLFLPESPRYLIETEHFDQAMTVLRKLHFDGGNAEWVQNEYSDIKGTIQAEKAIAVPGWAVMFRVPQWRTRLLYVELPWLV